eukprot:sb/3468318/
MSLAEKYLKLIEAEQENMRELIFQMEDQLKVLKMCQKQSKSLIPTLKVATKSEVDVISQKKCVRETEKPMKPSKTEVVPDDGADEILKKRRNWIKSKLSTLSKLLNEQYTAKQLAFTPVKPDLVESKNDKDLWVIYQILLQILAEHASPPIADPVKIREILAKINGQFRGKVGHGKVEEKAAEGLFRLRNNPKQKIQYLPFRDTTDLLQHVTISNNQSWAKMELMKMNLLLEMVENSKRTDLKVLQFVQFHLNNCAFVPPVVIG